MSTAARAKAEPRIRAIEVDDRSIVARLDDGRVISVPLSWSWRLERATPAQRSHYVISADGEEVHWPDIDEDISAHGMLQGTPAPRPKRKS